VSLENVAEKFFLAGAMICYGMLVLAVVVGFFGYGPLGAAPW